MFISSAFAQSPFGAGGTESLMSFLPIVLMFGVLYFLMIRPQMKRQKEQRAMVDALKAGDEIVTAGGILGRIVKAGEHYMTIEIADNAQIVVQRVAVQTLLPKGTIKSI